MKPARARERSRESESESLTRSLASRYWWLYGLMRSGSVAGHVGLPERSVLDRFGARLGVRDDGGARRLLVERREGA